MGVFYDVRVHTAESADDFIGKKGSTVRKTNQLLSTKCKLLTRNIHGTNSLRGNMAQLLCTKAFSANTFSLNVLPSFTAIYSQSIVNTNNFFTYFYQRKPISGE